jgi:uncharacterized protein
MGNLNSLLETTEHRLYPPPPTPWIMTQTWLELLFAHWTVPADQIRSRLPSTLELDLHEGSAYIGVVPFRMSNVRLRGTPAVGGLSEFLELNVRTYVTAGGVCGVYFFSLDASNPIAVRIARAWYRLPYFDARMSLDFGPDASRDLGLDFGPGDSHDLSLDKGKRDDDSQWIHYTSERVGSQNKHLEFRASYRPTAKIELAKKGSLEAFLTERYCLYVLNKKGVLCRGEIHHKPWPLQVAEARIEANTMGQPYGFDLSSANPLLHYSSRLETIEWPIQPVT